MSTATLEPTISARERPILFSGAMVKAILEGRKTMTRRAAKLPSWAIQNWKDVELEDGELIAIAANTGCFSAMQCPYGKVGDRLWVRETWRPAKSETHECFAYRADRQYRCNKPMPEPDGSTAGWKPSIHMPRKASRLLLEITNVRVQRLQDISEEDAIAEGLAALSKDGGQTVKYGIPDRDGLPGGDNIGWDWSRWCLSSRLAYEDLWNSINADKYPWASNPYVWVVSFQQVKPTAAIELSPHSNGSR
ncbi:MAG: hypothetical protein KME45_02915 [Stenomitos rutilans HA7619-LM2]|jgi:hypothetical protein|nr:hypothetical protein [Stenomitos rutilans HA7619-LM2]MBW4469335.1 hypothetical protein [Stenomitos rutilans HA7619-LM2]